MNTLENTRSLPLHAITRFTVSAAITTLFCLAALTSANATDSTVRSSTCDVSHGTVVRTWKKANLNNPSTVRADVQLIGLDDRLRWGRHPTIVLRTSPARNQDRKKSVSCPN